MLFNIVGVGVGVGVNDSNTKRNKYKHMKIKYLDTSIIQTKFTIPVENYKSRIPNTGI